MAAPGNAKRPELSLDRWQRVEELFHEALDLPAAERTGWLQSAAGGDAEVLAEVNSLLRNADAAEAAPLVQHLGPAIATLLAPPIRRAGPYRLVRELGQGGMGTVYLAERDDDEYKTQVAIKLVRRGLDTEIVLHRFYRERQTLARLQHPHIARLLDGGTTEQGEPYIVMEYVAGSRITEYCRARSLPVSQRILLFLNVCKAVDYAHRQFVVHRDIKPGNILVDETGDVKLLDFGICKLLQAHAQSGEDTLGAGLPPLTPDYASPEQIRGEPVTVTSDIYSLAAVLYELLTGAKPHRIENYTIQGLERGICETEVVRPSDAATDRSVAKQLKGDLDNILLFALRKDARERYDSVERFAGDLRRYLAYEPVLARPDSFAYRAGKFLRRRRGLAAAFAAVTLATSTGVAFSVRSARIANENLRMARQLSNTFVFDVYDSVRDLPGSMRARQLIVQTGLQYLDSLSRRAAGEADLRRELAVAYRRIGDVQSHSIESNPGQAPAALASYRKAAALAEGSLIRDREDASAGLWLAEIYQASAALARRAGDHKAARAHFAKTLELLKTIESAGPAGPELLRALALAHTGAGECDADLGDLEGAHLHFRAAVSKLEALVRLEPSLVAARRELLLAYSNLGNVLGNPDSNNLGDRAGAAIAYRQMADAARRMHVADPADARARRDYGLALLRLAQVLPDGGARERIAAVRQAIPLLRESLRADPRNTVLRSQLALANGFIREMQAAKAASGGLK
ncbi:MAG: serine/threonine protein kinase [Acidobacteria bacterium]|nr:serine/threonine protein kinase [Acidobacteriota bacterium]